MKVYNQFGELQSESTDADAEIIDGRNAAPVRDSEANRSLEEIWLVLSEIKEILQQRGG